MKIVVFLVLFFGVAGAMAQKKGVVVPLRAEAWKFVDGAVQFDDSAGVARMKIVQSRWFVTLKDMDFGDGTIEFDDVPTDPTFALFCFRVQDSAENECFYFRTQLGGHSYDMAAVQYTPIVKGVMYWDALPHYQTFCDFSTKKANHVKIVLSGRQMRVWVNDMERPTLEVGRLEGNTTHGTFAFQGQHIISNLVVKPGQVEGLSPVAETDPTTFDPRYLRHWQLAAPDTAGENSYLAGRFGIRGMPGDKAEWKPIDAERRGFVNLSRIFGRTTPFGVPRTMWLKTTIHADQAKTVSMRLGFLNEVSVFVNGGLVYVDKNTFGFPIAKAPRGRLSLENTTVSLPLKAGDNVLTMAVGNNFYSWGIIARLDDLEGLRIER